MKSNKGIIKIMLFASFGFVLYVVLRLGFAGAFQSSKIRDFEQIQKEGTLRVVTDYSVTGYYVSGDTIAGFQKEKIQALAKYLGLEVEISLENNLSACIEGLNSKKYDLIARNISVTVEHKQMVSFTNPILLDHQVLVQRTSEHNNKLSPIRNQIELGKKNIFVPENSPAALRLKNLSEEIADTIFIIEEKQYGPEQLIYMVAKGDIDYAVVNQQTALIYSKRFPELDIKTDIGFTQIQSWAVRLDSPVLLDSINSFLGK